MTSRELVIRTLEFDSPPRVPRQMWVLPWADVHHGAAVAALQERFPDDIISSPAFYSTDLPVDGERHSRGTYVDEWGCVFENIQDGVIGEVKEPILARWERLDDLRTPVERLTVDIDRVNAFCRNSDRFVIAGVCPRPFERLQFLRGTENLFCDLMDRPPGLFSLIHELHQFYLEELAVWARTDVDALFFMDDWGGQRSMLISPDLWREMLKPLYRDYIDLAHDAGKYMFVHSDGYIIDVIPDLIELGLDAINSQIFCMDPALLGDKFAGKITFWGELDRQHLLPHGSQADIIAAARQMADCLHRGGGLIAQCEFGAGADPDNVHTFFEYWEDSPPS